MLVLRDLTHRYPDDTVALDGLTLEAEPGILGLLGPNGAGKSTLMRILATLQAPTAGEVRFAGIDALAEPDRIRRRLGYLPQEFGVYPGVPLRRMLDHLAALKGFARGAERREAVDAMLARVNLWEARDRALAALSGGMRRRFGLAQALIADPDLLLLDEPSAGLDPEERNRLLDLVAEASERAVVILSTHLVEEAAAIASRVVVIVSGRIELDGVPEALVGRLDGRVWRRVLDRAAAAREADRSDVISVRLAAGRAVVRVRAETAPPGFEPAVATLEDAYLAAVAASRHG
ncbi:MAG: ATP-binding cassette domain-containing protein [Methylobacteriaceae bacterium]|nr:ATP-binding cassette domain-containing protein [Methylobacteriaceae bacterium]